MDQRGTTFEHDLSQLEEQPAEKTRRNHASSDNSVSIIITAMNILNTFGVSR